jgi:hypothetical protein
MDQRSESLESVEIREEGRVERGSTSLSSCGGQFSLSESKRLPESLHPFSVFQDVGYVQSVGGVSGRPVGIS